MVLVLWLLARPYATLPEIGDTAEPVLAFLFDEAHLLFDDASDALLEQIDLTARLIRSKGVGVFLATHTPPAATPPPSRRRERSVFGTLHVPRR